MADLSAQVRRGDGSHAIRVFLTVPRPPFQRAGAEEVPVAIGALWPGAIE